jgi:hypothetical protein
MLQIGYKIPNFPKPQYNHSVAPNGFASQMSIFGNNSILSALNPSLNPI